VPGLDVIGGGSRAEAWATILASALERPLTYRAGAAVGPALGAARLAWLSTTRAAPSSVCTPPPVERIVAPDAAHVARLSTRYSTFRRIYRAMQREFPCEALSP
jgi:xylulokinase